MRAEDTPEFCSLIRLYFQSWPKVFVGKEFLELWWRKLRNFELADIDRALDFLTDSEPEAPAPAKVREQANIFRKARELEVRRLADAKESAEHRLALAAPAQPPAPMGHNDADGDVTQRDKIETGIFATRLDELFRELQKDGLSQKQCQIRAFGKLIEEIAEKKKIADPPCKAPNRMR